LHQAGLQNIMQHMTLMLLKCVIPDARATM